LSGFAVREEMTLSVISAKPSFVVSAADSTDEPTLTDAAG
jgi:hypothetical protein